MGHKCKSILLLLGCCFLMTACLESRNLEELGLVTVAGYDKEEDLLRGTIVYYEFDPLHPNNTKLVSSVARTAKGIRQQENFSSSRRLLAGQVRAIIFGKELAEQGMIQYIDTLGRDAEIGTMVYMAVSETSAYDLLTSAQQSRDITNAGTYLYELIRQNVETESLLSPTLHEFMQCYYSEGRDATVPMLSFSQGTMYVKGLALFQDDRVVGSISTNELFYLKLIKDPFKSGNVELEMPKEDLQKFIKPGEETNDERMYLSLEHLRSNVKVKLVEEAVPSFEVTIKIDTRILEISENYDIGKPEGVKLLEKEISKDIAKHTEEIIYKLQEMNSDPIGFGNVYRARVGYKKFDKEQWRELYPNAIFTVKVDSNILRTGVMD
ncbi:MULTISPECIES: Ger(x)C family spore germination protein [Bacillus]|uniref:Ger(x)C family spore germination protein n=1 Tax=Bacillus TaxID=1386 RepID=UPI0012FEDEDF|nr:MULTISPECIES: Ger(x)C family spore germination protein [Bacillus]